MAEDPTYEELLRQNQELERANETLANRLIAAQAEAARHRDEAATLRRRINQPKPRDPNAKDAFLRPFRG